MSLKDLKQRSNAALADISNTPAKSNDEPNGRRATTGPGAMAFMQPTIDDLNLRAKSAEAKVEEFQRKLQEQPTEVALDDLEEVKSRRRNLSPEQFDELKANLRNNALVHPISVERAINGKYQIISGHNRVDAYRALGRKSILAVVRDIDPDKIDRSAFYANLLQPSLPDYDKFLGFKRERDQTGRSQKQLAEEAGVAESVLSMLFSFEQLPAEALAVIARNPSVIGMSCVAELAKATKGGKGARVVEAAERLVDGILSQKEAIRYVNTTLISPRAPEAAAVTKVRAGRHEFCHFVGRGKTLRIDFTDESQRTTAEEAIAKLLKNLAKQFDASSKF